MAPSTASRPTERSSSRTTPEVGWTLRWRAILPATSPNTVPAPASLEASVSENGILVGLRDRRGKLLFEQRIESTFDRTIADGHVLLEWTAPSRASTGPPLARILVATGQGPLVRTMLPELVGLPGGRYDLAEAIPVPGAVASRPS